MLTAQEVLHYLAEIEEKYFMLKDVYAASDGLKLQPQQSGDAVAQKIFYNAWTHEHYVGNVFMFAPSGVTIACTVSALENMHDLCIVEWSTVYDNLKALYNNTGGRVVVNSAFAPGSYAFLIESVQDEQGEEDAHDLIQIQQANALRQASEKGMRGFQGSFPLVKDRFYVRGAWRTQARAMVHRAFVQPPHPTGWFQSYPVCLHAFARCRDEHVSEK